MLNQLADSAAYLYFQRSEDKLKTNVNTSAAVLALQMLHM